MDQHEEQEEQGITMNNEEASSIFLYIETKLIFLYKFYKLSAGIHTTPDD